MKISLIKTSPSTRFKNKFLLYLKSKSPQGAYVYDFITEYSKYNRHKINLLQIKSVITDLIKQDFISSQSFNYNLIGIQGVEEEYQKRKAICTINDKGLEYLKNKLRSEILFVMALSGGLIGVIKFFMSR